MFGVPIGIFLAGRTEFSLAFISAAFQFLPRFAFFPKLIQRGLHADVDVVIEAFGKNEQMKKVFWSLFVGMAGLVLARVVDPVIAQQVVKEFPFFLLPMRPLKSEGMYHEGKQAQIGLRLSGFGPEPPSKTVWFRNVKISTLISLRLQKYGFIGLEKRGSPRPFKSRLFFPGSLSV